MDDDFIIGRREEEKKEEDEEKGGVSPTISRICFWQAKHGKHVFDMLGRSFRFLKHSLKLSGPIWEEEEEEEEEQEEEQKEEEEEKA